MKTSQKQTSQNGKEKSISSPEDFLASLFPLPEAEREQKMTAIFGHRCFVPSKKSGRLGSLVKMLLGSSRWYSPVKRLRWVCIKIPKEKITLKRKFGSDSSLTKSVKTLKKSVIPSNRLLYRLVPSERHTGETEFGLLLKTPSAFDATVKSGKKNPVSGDSGSLAQEIMSGYIQKRMLPTPYCGDATGGAKKLSNDKRHCIQGKGFSARLNDLAKARMLPTPKTQYSKGNARRNRGRFNLTDKVAEIYNPAGETSQLNPLFVTEMMGFPTDWLVLPFLNGE